VDGEELLLSKVGSVKAALTGSVASGKSTVAALLAAFGADIIDFDILARDSLAPQTEELFRVAQLFGPKCLNQDHSLNRTYVGQIIFKDRAKRLALEAIVHPKCWLMMLEKLKSLSLSPLVVIDVPLLFEAALNSLFNPVVLSFAKPERQLQRLMERNPKLGRRQAKRIIESQWPISQKVRLASFIVDNDGSVSYVIEQTKQLYERLINWGHA
jgi:dephospho-CoA kinase